MLFYENFLDLCNKIGKTPSRVVIENDISKASVCRWKQGSVPSDAKIKKLADYFGVTTEYLLKGKEKTATQKDDGLSAEFISLYNRLDEPHKQAVRQLIKTLLSSQ